MFKDAIDQAIDLLKVVVKKDELYSLQAESMMKMKKALMSSGFTEEQAIQIVASQGSGINMK